HWAAPRAPLVQPGAQLPASGLSRRCSGTARSRQADNSARKPGMLAAGALGRAPPRIGGVSRPGAPALLVNTTSQKPPASAFTHFGHQSIRSPSANLAKSLPTLRHAHKEELAEEWQTRSRLKCGGL